MRDATLGATRLSDRNLYGTDVRPFDGAKFTYSEKTQGYTLLRRQRELRRRPRSANSRSASKTCSTSNTSSAGRSWPVSRTTGPGADA